MPWLREIGEGEFFLPSRGWRVSSVGLTKQIADGVRFALSAIDPRAAHRRVISVAAIAAIRRADVVRESQDRDPDARP